MSGQIGQTGRKKTPEKYTITKIKEFFFKDQMQKKIQGRENQARTSRNMAIKNEKK